VREPPDDDAELPEPDSEVEPDLEAGSVVELPLTDVLDLHGFRPGEMADVVRTYLDAAHAAGFAGVRLIHGRGIGVQRAAVRALLERDPRVASFGDAPGEAGGWGATVVVFRR
jgi:dsDNA-specific endonuclease/ATPase MutS2